MKKLLIFVFLGLIGCSPPKTQREGAKEFIPKPVKSGIELIGDFSMDSLKAVFSGSSHAFYRWKNHFLIFGEVKPQDTIGLSALGQIRYYALPVYRFEKAIHCEDKSPAETWRDYVLIANLVEDKASQQAYLDYHNTQFEQWPEVAAGFCAADFQRLCVYKNDRQLLLVISVPADKTLDELNPLTVKDNPKMDEWNQLMAQYQEGVPGTAPGETWVFLEPYQ